MKIKVLSDSTWDLSPELLQKYDITLVPLTVIKNGENFSDGVNITPDEIFSHAHEMLPAEVTFRIFDVLADFMTQELLGIAKIDFELSVLAMNAPGRAKKILAGANSIGHKEYIMMRTADYFAQKLEIGSVVIEQVFFTRSDKLGGIHSCK